MSFNQEQLTSADLTANATLRWYEEPAPRSGPVVRELYDLVQAQLKLYRESQLTMTNFISTAEFQQFARNLCKMDASLRAARLDPLRERCEHEACQDTILPFERIAMLLLFGGAVVVQAQYIVQILRMDINKTRQCPVFTSQLLGAFMTLEPEGGSESVVSLCYTHWPGDRTRKTFARTNHYIAKAVEQTLRGDQLVWFDQTMHCLNSSYLPQGWAGLEFDAYFCRDLLDVPVIIKSPQPANLWDGRQASFWYSAEKILAGLTDGINRIEAPTDLPWAFSIDSQMRLLMSLGLATYSELRAVFCLLMNQFESGSQPSWSNGKHLAECIVSLAESEISPYLDFGYSGGPNSIHGPSFLLRAGFVTSSIARQILLETGGDYGTGTLADLLSSGLEVDADGDVSGQFRVFKGGFMVGLCRLTEIAGVKQVTYRGSRVSDEHVLVRSVDIDEAN